MPPSFATQAHSLIPPVVYACGLSVVGASAPAPCSVPLGKFSRKFPRRKFFWKNLPQLHPLVAPQVLHFMQVPLRTSV